MQASEREQEGGQSKENERETAPVSDSVPVRPSTSAESPAAPAATDNEEFDPKETNNGMSSQYSCYKIVCNLNCQ